MSEPTVAPRAAAGESTRSRGVRNSLARRLVRRRLEMPHAGRIEIIDPVGRYVLPVAEDADPEFRVRVRIHDSAFYTRTLFAGPLGVAEAYLDGLWECDDLLALLRIFARRASDLDRLDRGPARIGRVVLGRLNRLRRNSLRGSRRNIREHYDLGNEFFRLMLDETMTYSSGIFEHEDATLHDASVAKLDRICRRLGLKPGQRVLETGSGWGSFALHAARHYGCHVTTTTISREQYELASERIRAAGLEDRITLLEQDYRDLRGTYDRVVSIEMIEAVGHQYLESYFRACTERLAPDGLMLAQVITMPDHLYPRYLRGVAFIRRFVFPGSCCPAISAVTAAAGRAGDLKLVHLEDITEHYAKTLRCWRDNFTARLDDVRRLGYPERFLRLWAYYLCYCEAGFRERAVADVQMLFARPGYRGSLPLSERRTGDG